MPFWHWDAYIWHGDVVKVCSLDIDFFQTHKCHTTHNGQISIIISIIVIISIFTTIITVIIIIISVKERILNWSIYNWKRTILWFERHFIFTYITCAQISDTKKILNWFMSLEMRGVRVWKTIYFHKNNVLTKRDWLFFSFLMSSLCIAVTS